MAKKSEDQQKLDSVQVGLENLRARRKDLQEQIDFIDAEIKKEVTAEWALKDAIKTAKPLTPAMKATLRAMAEGSVLIRRSYGYPERYYLDRAGQPQQTVRGTVFDGLQERRLIQTINDAGYRQNRFELSEHGRNAVA